MTAKLFLKWAGGKRQLLAQIVASLPDELAQGGIDRYIEPFLGGGAVFLHIAQNYSIAESYLADRNEELALAYQSVQQRVEEVIAALDSMERVYTGISPAQQKSYFYAVRSQFNAERPQTDFSCPSPHSVKRTAQLIFLNRTCFNGLFRVNAKGEFNVPFGSYTNPLLCDADNLRVVSGSWATPVFCTATLLSVNLTWGHAHLFTSIRPIVPSAPAPASTPIPNSLLTTKPTSGWRLSIGRWMAKGQS